ncbi:hypothetical protein [Polyangium aurulentum]|uniref:hypothetical protein n=1 Tax=Polyangium aurulentum TaxID=2567896 RepID=UPI0010AE4EBE|nr:hypothetical protein [Polyangium aurulentum]UQA57961.1 hypothetical protein E8A73_042950 [Polyangium aurulentum]
MKYCPYLSCPHRKRVQSPAEFVGRVTVCSDCGTPLVDTEGEAVEGIHDLVSAKAGPYRDPSAHTLAVRDDDEERARTDKLVGASFIFGALLLLFGAAPGSIAWMGAWCAAIYGIVRLVRGFSAARRKN